MTSSVIDAPDVTGLIELSRDPQLDLKPVILRVQTDMFLAAPIRDRAVLTSFASLAAGLISTVDDDTVLTVARKLAPCLDTPGSVLEAIASRGGEAGELATEALSARAQVAALARHAADLAAARDPASKLDAAALDRMMGRARADCDLAKALLARRDLAPAEIAPLWLHAEPAQRLKIQDAVAATAALRSHPAVLRDLGATLTALSRDGDVTAFSTALADALGLPAAFMMAAPNPALRYDLLTLALRAADLSEAEAVYVFLTLNATVARSADRVFSLVQLFRSLTRPAARDLIGAILDVRLPERMASAEHRPYYAPDAEKLRQAVERVSPRNVLPTRARQTN